MQAVILAAGKGLRLRPFTEHHPKPLIPIADKPLLEYTLESLPDKIDKILIVIGYLGQQIKDHFKESWNGKPITYVEQTELLGTGDAILRVKDFVKEKFLVVNGDDLYDKNDLQKLISNGVGLLAWPSNKAYEFGLKIDSEGLIEGFDSSSGLTICGAYALTKDFYDQELVKISVNEKTEYSLPHTLINLAKTQPVHAIMASNWLPVGTPIQLDFANNYYVKKYKNN